MASPIYCIFLLKYHYKINRKGYSIIKEKICTVPVNDTFALDSECPIYSMLEKLESDAVEYVRGPSYMEDDIREKTDKMGFCSRHIKKIYEQNNRLGYALIMKTHMDYVIKQIESYSYDKGTVKTLLKKAKRHSHVVILMSLRENALCAIR